MVGVVGRTIYLQGEGNREYFVGPRFEYEL